MNKENKPTISRLVRIRQDYNITLPKTVRTQLDLNIGDHIQFQGNGQGKIEVYKIIPIRLTDKKLPTKK